MEQNQVTRVYKQYLAMLSSCFWRENTHTLPNGHTHISQNYLAIKELQNFLHSSSCF